MEREIKFRGYSKELHKWVFGYLYEHPRMGYFILEDEGEEIENRVRVDAESIGQFTECFDKNGAPIYEGDIVDLEVLNAFRKSATIRTKICYEHGCFCPLDEAMTDMANLKVIGNKYENKELLEE